jgi:hypothetical protein
MEVRIGVTYSAKELTVEVDQGADEIVAAVDAALADDAKPVMWLTDTKGRRVGIPTDKLAYVEVVEEDSSARMGFGRR